MTLSDFSYFNVQIFQYLHSFIIELNIFTRLPSDPIHFDGIIENMYNEKALNGLA